MKLHPRGRLVASLAQRRLRRARRIIERSGLFDETFYRSRAALEPGSDPISHYLLEGWRQLNPNQLFDIGWYLETYASLLRPSDNPLIDFIKRSPARNPGPYFDAARYLSEHPDVAASGANPLAHYLQFGKREGRAARLVANSVPTRGAPLTRFQSWLSANALSDVDIEELNERLIEAGESLPRISIVMPVYGPNEQLLMRAIESVRRQICGRWELWLVDDGNSDATGALIDWWAAQDQRIAAVHLGQNRGISAATNAGAAVAKGDVLLFLDQDDELSPDCIAEMAIHYAEFPTSDLVYSDDDKIDVSGQRYDPQVKPDWSPALLLSRMYFGHVLTVRRALFESLGGFRSEFDGAQDFDFALRAVEVARRVGHVAKIVYHWRAVEGSTALSANEKPRSIERGRAAVEQALQRRGIAGATVTQAEWAEHTGAGAYSLRFSPNASAVAVILEVGSNLESLRRCVEALRSSTPAPAEIVLSRQAVAVEPDGIAALADEFNCRHVLAGTAQILDSCTSELLLFLSGDLVPTTPDWISQLAGWMGVGRTGIVGARVIGNRRLAEAGRIRGANGLPTRAFDKLGVEQPGYLGLARTTRETWSVGRRCLMTRRSIFADLGGFPDEDFDEELAAADFCRRAAEEGHETVVCGSVDFEFRDEKQQRRRRPRLGVEDFRSRYGSVCDHSYSSHLSPERGRFEISSLRPEIRSERPIRLAAVSHNLNREGASNVLLDLLIGLNAVGAAQPLVISPTDGPLRQAYEAAGIAVAVKNDLDCPLSDRASLQARLSGFASLLQSWGAEVCLANTLQSYWAVRSAVSCEITSLWAQHESDPWETYFDFLPADIRSVAFESFADAYQVIYVAEATREAWRALETRHNFQVIRHGLPKDMLVRERTRWDKQSARTNLNISQYARVICLMGTVCRRKGQLDAIEAYSKLPSEIREDTYVYIAGGNGEEAYVAECERAASESAGHIRMVGPVDDPFLYYRAADLALCTSRIESAPRVLIEAMACDLPIVATPVFGIPEMVSEDINALFYEPGDTEQLARQLERLLRDDQLRSDMASSSSQVLTSQPGYAEMVAAYRSCVRQAAGLSMRDYLHPHGTFTVPLA